MEEDLFQKKNFLKRMRMPLPQLEAYYRAQRADDDRRNVPIKGIKRCKRFHPIMMLIIRIEELFVGHRITVIHNRYPIADDPTIYACAHVGRYDIETVLRSIPEQGWLFMGDPGMVYKSPDALLLWLNGIIYADTAYRDDCHVGLKNCIRILRAGGSMIIYPEGAWNITDNLPVMKLYDGCAEIAIRTGCGIVPVAIEKTGRHYDVNVGSKISPAAYTLADKKKMTSELRDALCSLKWEIYESHGITRRSDLPDDMSERFLSDIMAETENGYTLDVIERTRYHDKNVTEPAEAFAFMDRLIPGRKNAFLVQEAWKRKKKWEQKR